MRERKGGRGRGREREREGGEGGEGGVEGTDFQPAGSIGPK